MIRPPWHIFRAATREDVETDLRIGRTLQELDRVVADFSKRATQVESLMLRVQHLIGEEGNDTP